MSDAGGVRITESKEETRPMEKGFEGILEKVPDLWTIISCLQQMNCLNQRRKKSKESTGEVSDEEKKAVDNQEEPDSIEETRTVDNQEETDTVQSHEDRCRIESTEENLNKSQEGSSNESEKEDDPVQRSEEEVSQRMTKWEMICTLILCFTPIFLYPRPKFNDDQSFWFFVLLADVLLIFAFALFYTKKRMNRGSLGGEDEEVDEEDEQPEDEDAQPDDEYEQPDYEDEPKTSWTRAQRIVSNIVECVFRLVLFAVCLTYILPKYIGYPVVMKETTNIIFLSLLFLLPLVLYSAHRRLEEQKENCSK